MMPWQIWLDVGVGLLVAGALFYSRFEMAIEDALTASQWADLAIAAIMLAMFLLLLAVGGDDDLT